MLHYYFIRDIIHLGFEIDIEYTATLHGSIKSNITIKCIIELCKPFKRLLKMFPTAQTYFYWLDLYLTFLWGTHGNVDIISSDIFPKQRSYYLLHLYPAAIWINHDIAWAKSPT